MRKRRDKPAAASQAECSDDSAPGDDSSHKSDAASASEAKAKRQRRDLRRDERERECNMALDSGLAFSDRKHVFIHHQDPRQPQVRLWKADIVRANPDSGTFDVHIHELVKDVLGVRPNDLFVPNRILAAVG